VDPAKKESANSAIRLLLMDSSFLSPKDRALLHTVHHSITSSTMSSSEQTFIAIKPDGKSNHRHKHHVLCRHSLSLYMPSKNAVLLPSNLQSDQLKLIVPRFRCSAWPHWPHHLSLRAEGFQDGRYQAQSVPTTMLARLPYLLTRQCSHPRPGAPREALL